MIQILLNRADDIIAHQSVTTTRVGHKNRAIFTALHGMQARSSNEKAVRLFIRRSVRPSVKRVDCDKTEERSVQIFIPYERSFSLVF